MALHSGARIAQNSVVVMCGITKVFVGSLTEAARTVMSEWKQTGPIKPEHLREVRSSWADSLLFILSILFILIHFNPNVVLSLA
jgi:hypothetical protein